MHVDTLPERLQVLRERYYLFVGPMLIMLAVGLRTSPLLVWVAGSLLGLLTANKFYPFIVRSRARRVERAPEGP